MHERVLEGGDHPVTVSVGRAQVATVPVSRRRCLVVMPCHHGASRPARDEAKRNAVASALAIPEPAPRPSLAG
jgi:hypothetical protein